MVLTSAEAGKLLRKLNEELEGQMTEEEMSREFLASVGEDVEACRPEYDYAAAQQVMTETERKIRALKHAISMFNLTHEVPGFGMTIDEMLVYIPQLTRRKAKLGAMKARLPRQREESRGHTSSPIIDYRYVNYDLKQVSADFAAVSDELARAQTALDMVNSTVTFEAEL